MKTIYDEIQEEEARQLEKWGEQNHPILDPELVERSPERMCVEYDIPSEVRAKQVVELHDARGDLTYMHILIEEVSEAASCGTDAVALRQELIQVVAVGISMIKSLDRNGR
jgi:hypothetical protein